VSGFGFRVSDSGFRVLGFGFRVLGFGLRVEGLGAHTRTETPCGSKVGAVTTAFRVKGLNIKCPHEV